jgi:dipeptidase E
MTKQIIAIGGGGFGRNPSDGIIEKYIIDQSEKENPNICFIPTATGDNESYKVNFYSIFSQLNCTPSQLDFFKRTAKLEDLIFSQDIVFVGGGNTKSMLAVWKDWGLVQILKEAYEVGTIMCGVSAGAICWFENGITDSWADELRFIDCLGFVPGSCCPHYDEEPERRTALNNFLSEGALENCNAIDGGCALHIKDGVEYKAIVFAQDKNAYLVHRHEQEIVERPYLREEIF